METSGLFFGTFQVFVFSGAGQLRDSSEINTFGRYLKMNIMDITELLNSNLGKQIAGGIANKSGATEQETLHVIKAAGPALMEMLQANASTQQGEQGILSALQKHDGSILDNLSSYLGSPDASDGNAILGHILGDKRGQLETALSKQTGVDSSKISGILAMIAPIIMGFLGKQTKTAGGLGSGGGIGDLLGSLVGSGKGSSGSGNILESLLGKGQGGGNIGDALGSLLGKDQKSQGGLGDMLGGLFGKK